MEQLETSKHSLQEIIELSKEYRSDVNYTALFVELTQLLQEQSEDSQ